MRRYPAEIKFFDMVFKRGEPELTMKPGGFEMVYRLKYTADGVPEGVGPTLTYHVPAIEATDDQVAMFEDNFRANIAKWLANYFMVSVTMDEMSEEKIGGTD